jgi:Ca-activated chloride channel homolog
MRRSSTIAVLFLALLGCRKMPSETGDAEWGGQEGEPTVTDPSDTAIPDDAADTGDGDTDAPDTCNDTDPVVLYVSPDDSNSMASPVLAREAALRSGWAFPDVRAWEFLNYYDFAYPPAAPGELRVVPTLVRDPASPEDTFVLQVGIASEPLANADRRPMNLTFVVDTSCSMGGDPMELVHDLGEVVAGSLREGDVVSVLTWNASQSVRLEGHAVTGGDDAAVRDAFTGLETEGGTDLHAGLLKGYELAEAQASTGRINRVVLISDGGANLGVTDANLIGAKAGGAEQDGIYLVGVGVGTPTSYNDALMDEVTDLGKGAAVFLPNRAEATRIFRDRFVETFDVAARNVRIRLDLPPGFAVTAFSGEEISDDPVEVDPQHLAPNDTMVVQQTLHGCSADHTGDSEPIGVTVTWQDPRTFEAREAMVTTTIGELLQSETPLVAKASAILAYADLLETLATSPSGRTEKIAVVRGAVELALADNPADPDLTEILQVLDAL